MTRPLTRDEASRVLGIPATTDVSIVKRAYRRLAREHHPDLGGDPDTFHALQRAYERLVHDDDVRPLVSRGRPSRPPVRFTDDTERVDLGSVDWDATVPEGQPSLTPDRLAVWLANGEDGRLRPLVATSRSPGSRLNRLSAKLAPDLTSRLRIAPVLDDRGANVIAIELVASNRRARKALDAAPLDGVWVRTRRSSSTLLRSTLPPSIDVRASSVRATERTTSLLGSLGWPITGWMLTSEAP